MRHYGYSKYGLFFLFWIYGQWAYAQSFDHLYVSGGLSQSTVLSICRDSSGFMWFGTRDGLNRYDSRSFKIFQSQPHHPNTISTGEYIYAIYQDHQSNLWIGTRYGLNRYLPREDGFEKIFHTPSAASLSDNNVYCIFQDHAGRLWFGTENGLNMLANAQTRQFTHFTASNNRLSGNQIYAIMEDSSGNIWVGTTQGLTCMSLRNGQWSFRNFFHNPVDPSSLSDHSIKALSQDQQGYIWVGTESGGLDKWITGTASFVHFKHSPASNSISSNNIRKIITDKSGLLWIATIDGLNILDPRTDVFQVLKHDPENNRSLSDNSIKDIYQDNDGSVWIGTMYGGVNVMHQTSIPFNIYHYSKFRNSVSSDIISSLLPDSASGLWIGTEGQGLNFLDIKSGHFTHFVHKAEDGNSLGVNFIKAIVKDERGCLWIGTYLGGVDRYDPQTGHFTHFTHHSPNSLSSDNVVCLYMDSYNRLWAGTSKGLDIYDAHRADFRPANAVTDGIPSFSSRSIRAIMEDSGHNLWIGTANGLNRITADGQIASYLVSNNANNGQIKGYINCIYEDHQHNIYVGTHGGGLNIFQPTTNSFAMVTVADGLPSNNVMAIQQDNGNALWLTTDNGLVSYHLLNKKIKIYNTRDGLPTNEFNANSSCRSTDGTLFFGSYNGLVSLGSDTLTENRRIPQLVFTGLKLFNSPVDIRGQDGLLTADISFVHDLRFRYNQNIFTLDFAALNFVRSSRNRYAYRLDGFEKDWTYTTTPSVTYMNLPAGNYDLYVKGSNNDGYWGPEAKLHIRILPPWWRTWWAYALYVCIVGIALYFVIRFFRRQARLERDLHYEHLNTQRKEELYQLRLDFFTKVSHEIRTPLTLILAPLEKLISLTAADQGINNQLFRVRNNANRLLKLVGELLDFRKMESLGMHLRLERKDMVSFSQKIFDSFWDVAENRDIQYHFRVGMNGQVVVNMDASQFEKVLYNLLANAFKYTPAGGTVTLELSTDADSVIVRVRDNGIGIPYEDQSRIFDDFYQADTGNILSKGWGIGLALVKKIVEAHNGHIHLDSVPAVDDHNGHTCFSVTIPLAKNTSRIDEVAEDYVPVLETPVESIMENVLPEGADTGLKYTVLILEDNQEVREFLSESLNGQYRIMEAGNGVEGWEIASRHIPDLIISDVMMPEMDGLDFCTRVKKDQRTDHIPIILLTARTTPPQQMEGLHVGADAYLTKPFSVQMLELTVRNLLALKEAMRRQYSQQVTLMPKNKVITTPEEDFLDRLMEIIEKEMDNADFKVTDLVTKIGMSQTVLYKKIKALTGMSITDFVKSTRLKHAAQLLVQHKLTVAEVAYAVGFTDPKYFGKEFRKQFGISPSEYARQAENEMN